MRVKQVIIEGLYCVEVENNEDKAETMLGVAGWNLIFKSKQDVEEHIEILNKALEFWEYP